MLSAFGEVKPERLARCETPRLAVSSAGGEFRLVRLVGVKDEIAQVIL